MSLIPVREKTSLEALYHTFPNFTIYPERVNKAGLRTFSKPESGTSSDRQLVEPQYEQMVALEKHAWLVSWTLICSIVTTRCFLTAGLRVELRMFK